MPNPNSAEMMHDAEKQRHEQKRHLRDDENEFAIAAINDRAAHSGKQHAWQAETKAFEPQIKRRIGELKDQPTLRRGLNQSAGVAEE